jgi:hypothetical protein
MCFDFHGLGQEIIKRNSVIDTLYVNDESFENLAEYGARDSIHVDLKENKIHLYGDAFLSYLETNMKAGYILVDLSRKEVFATYVYDRDSNKRESPTFLNEGEKIEAARIRYNFNTEKGYIEEVKIKQDEIYLYMGVAKRQKNGDIHFKEGRFSTCDLDDPHYHFQLSKAVMIPNKRIVTGPMNLWLKGVPTPFGLPFSVIPQAKDRTHGLLFPQIIPMSAYGFGVQDAGYFFPVNKSLSTSAYITLFNRGSWGVRNRTEYLRLYRQKGEFDIGYTQFRLGFPLNSNNNKLSVKWNHQKDRKSNPYWVFSSSVNFMSDNNNKNNLNPQNTQYFNNQLNSDINLVRSFPGKPITMGAKLGLKQSTKTKNISLTSPTVNVNVTRFFPLRNMLSENREWKKVFTRMSISYNLESQNKSTFHDSLLKNNAFPQIRNQFVNGVSQGAIVQTTASFFQNTWKLNPSLTYNNRLNFQQIEKSYNPITKEVSTDSIQKMGYSQDLSMTASLTTVIYSYYKFAGKKKPLLRHLLTPSFGFSYIPNLNTNAVLDTGNVITGLGQVNYSIFEHSAYTQRPTNSAALLTFGFNNTFELKTISSKDSLTGFKKTKIIDALTINGNFDLLKDSMNLSDISLNLRLSPVSALNFVASSTVSPYEWNSATGKAINEYALSTSGKLGRFMSTQLTTTYTITSKESREKMQTLSEKNGLNWNADYAYFTLYPERMVNFDIPWKFNFTHVYSVIANVSKNSTNSDSYLPLQTLSANGDVSFTKRWKIIGTVNLDIQTTKITYTTLTLSRDMHCWAMSFNWIPIGGNQSFLFSLRSTASLFKDAKLDLRKPPLFF